MPPFLGGGVAFPLSCRGQSPFGRLWEPNVWDPWGGGPGFSALGGGNILLFTGLADVAIAPVSRHYYSCSLPERPFPDSSLGNKEWEMMQSADQI